MEKKETRDFRQKFGRCSHVGVTAGMLGETVNEVRTQVGKW